MFSHKVEFYKHDLPHAVMFPTEYHFWMRKRKQHGAEVPKKMVDTLKSCDFTTFPNIWVLLQFALTIPTTSCEYKMSCSQLKLIKTSRHSTTSAGRMSGLAMMKIHRVHCEQLQQSPSKLKELVQTFSSSALGE